MSQTAPSNRGPSFCAKIHPKHIQTKEETVTSSIFKDRNYTHVYNDVFGEMSAQECEQIALAVASVKADKDKNTPGLSCFFQSAVNIYKDFMAWQEKNFYLQVFKKTYLLGYSKKHKIVISFHRGLWFASSNNYAVALEDVLRRIPQKTPNSIEW